MYSKGKGMPQLPIESHAREKLNVYVYEFLIHLGAKNTAQTFLNELRWEKPLQIGEAPGFLISWWNVFWDLYCTANPERREQCDTSGEAKAFHDYTSNMMINQPQGPPDPNNMQQNPNHQMMNTNNNFFNAPGGQGPTNQMMNPGPQYQRFHPQGPRPIRMPSNMEFNPGVNNMNPNQMTADQNRVQPGMSPINRLTPPGNRMPPGMQPQQGPVVGNQMNFNGAPNPQQMRGPPSQAPTPGMPNTPQQIPNQPMSPISMPMQQQQQRWNQVPNPNQPLPPQQQGQPIAPGQQPGLPPPPPNQQPHNMNYQSASPPLAYQNVQMAPHHAPGTPGIISSPSDANGDLNFNNLMKNVPGGMQFHNEQSMGHMVPLNADMAHHNQMNNEMIESIKHSPIQNMPVSRHPGEEHNGGNPMGDINYNHFADPGLF